MFQVISGWTKACRDGTNLHFCFGGQGSGQIKPGSVAAWTPTPLQKGDIPPFVSHMLIFSPLPFQDLPSLQL